MVERLGRLCLGVLRVPPEPHPPLGGPGSVRVFRAGRNYFRLRVFLWSLRQAFTAVVFIASVYVLGVWLPGAGLADGAPGAGGPGFSAAKSPAEALRAAAARTPRWVFTAVWVFKGAAFLGFLGQMAVSYALLRLEYEQRWYIVTDRSLRLRSGLWAVREMTMSFANIQQITLTQGPLQRVMRLADVRVESAGGGRTPERPGEAAPSLHTGVLHAVENAAEVRDLIVERLRRYRESGLGDTDEAVVASRASRVRANDGAAAEAARILLAEAKALRGAVAQGAALPGAGGRPD